MRDTSNTVQAFWVALGSLSTICLSILSAVILSRYFDKTEYGTYKQILYVYSTLFVVFTAGLPKVFAYFLPRYSLDEGASIVIKISKVLFIAGLLFSGFIYLFSDVIALLLKNDELAYALKVFSPIPALLLPTLGIEGIFSTYKRTVFIAIYNSISRLLTLVFIVSPVIFFKGNYIDAIYGWIVASLIILCIAFIFKSIPFRGATPVKTTLRLGEIFRYSIPLVVASLWGIAIHSADQFYISRYFGTEVFAEFSNGFIELPFVSMIATSASVVLMPIFSRHFHERRDPADLIVTWRSALQRSAYIIYPLVVFFFVYSSQVMILLYSEKYVNSASYFKISLILNFFNIVIFAPLFFSLGKTALYAKIHMYLAFVIWVSHYLVIIFFQSPIAVAINSTTIHVVKTFIFLYLSGKLLDVNFMKLFPIRVLGMLLLHSFVIIAILKIVESFMIIDFLLLKMAALFLIYFLLLVTTGNLFNLDYFSVVKPLLKKLKFTSR